MFVRGFLIASLTLLGLGNMGFTQPAAPPLAQDENRIDELIHKLGSSKFQERRAAQKELEAIGAPALAPLKKFQGSTDPEISKRCGDLVRAIEEKVLTARLLAPKRVQVNFTGLPALHAVAELTKQSGYLIQVRGDRTKLAGKKTSLPAGELTFWQAFDQLCDDIGLAEQTGVPQDQHAAELIGAGGRVDRLFMDNLMAGAKSVEIVAIPGTPKNRNVSYAGAVRSRIYARDGKANGEYQLTLEVSAEPGLQEFTIVGAPSFDKAIDDQGQNLELRAQTAQTNSPAPGFGVAVDPFLQTTASRRQFNLSFKAGKPAQGFKELTGTFAARLLGPPETIFTLSNVLNAVGESVKSKSGETFTLASLEKLDNGDYKLQVRHAKANANGPGVRNFNGVIQMTGEGNIPKGIPELLDARGGRFQVIQVPLQRTSISTNSTRREFTIIYRGHNEPETLTLLGAQPVIITIPFAFRDVPLR